MIDFPASPTVGQQFTAAGVTWTWDGVKWAASGLSVAYLPLSGGSLTGPLLLAADPTASLGAATKQYADGARWGENRIVNGDMRIDQRNAGASGTAGGYTVDRWAFGDTQASKGTWQRIGPSATTTPFGFPYYLQFTSSSAYTPLAADYFSFSQAIEADMVGDFAWGTPQAQPVTLSFWASATVTGIFSGTIRNYAGTRSYPFTFSLPVSGLTKIVVLIPGDTTGTWVMGGNAGSVIVTFDLGSGANFRGPAGAWTNGNFIGANGAVSVVATNGAVFALTGVKLEIGSVATPYNRQSLAKSLADCQRYYQANAGLLVGSYAAAGGSIWASIPYITTMRANPTVALSNQAYNNGSGLAAQTITTSNFQLTSIATAAGATWGQCNATFSAEL